MRAAVAIDTNALVKRLASAGMSGEASVQLCQLLNEALYTAVQGISESSVARASFQKEMSLFNVELSKLKGDLHNRHSLTYQSSKQSLETLLRELRSSRQRARETLGAIRSETRLEINLERGRQRDAALATALKFQDLQTQVDAEVGNAHAALAKLRHDIFYSLTGFLFTSIAAYFGFLRLTS